MTIDEIRTKWVCAGGAFTHISAETISGFHLKPETILYLTRLGLPSDPAPHLSFSINNNDTYEGINTLTSQYDFLEPAEDYHHFVVIGSCHDGDVIAIDTSNNDELVWLDHEDYFSSRFFNSSLRSLFMCLIAYIEFIRNIQNDNGPDAYINSDFTDEQFNTLKEKIIIADKRAVTENGFWKSQLEMDLDLRNEAGTKK